MKSFVNITSKCLPFSFANVDTDQIIPKQFLKLTQRTGFGKYLFYNWRFNKDGSINDKFILNDSKYSNRKILLTLDNFGSGSSREHAVWALLDYGFKVIIAPSFADIFYNNCIKNGVLPIKLPKNEINYLFSNDELSVYVNLKKQELVISSFDIKTNRELSKKMTFDIEHSKKQILLDGLDEIDITLKLESKITEYEDTRHQ
ncbi:MAG: 3-isopropylmalate dehydratase small subunit [Nitrososphaeraceae archaeon]